MVQNSWNVGPVLARGPGCTGVLPTIYIDIFWWELLYLNQPTIDWCEGSKCVIVSGAFLTASSSVPRCRSVGRLAGSVVVSTQPVMPALPAQPWPGTQRDSARTGNSPGRTSTAWRRPSNSLIVIETAWSLWRSWERWDTSRTKLCRGQRLSLSLCLSLYPALHCNCSIVVLFML